jgi:hypothetical protein
VLGAGADTDAVKVTDCPNADGDPDDEMTVAVAAAFTGWVNPLDVLAVDDGSPL